MLTRDRNWGAAGAEVAHDVAGALALAGEGPVAVIGGAEIFDLFRTIADRVELTEINIDADGDTVVPLCGMERGRRQDHPAIDDRPAYSFVTLTR